MCFLNCSSSLKFGVGKNFNGMLPYKNITCWQMCHQSFSSSWRWISLTWIGQGEYYDVKYTVCLIILMHHQISYLRKKQINANKCNHWKWYLHQCASCPKLLCLENPFELIWNLKSKLILIWNFVFLEHTKPKLYVLHPSLLIDVMSKGHLHRYKLHPIF